MRFVDDFCEYELIDADDGERLERWGNIILIRPDPQIMWKGKRTDRRWNDAHAIYHRSSKGGGYWEPLKKVPDVWSIEYNGLTFRLKPMGFKHTGLFPEQAINLFQKSTRSEYVMLPLSLTAIVSAPALLPSPFKITLIASAS